MNKPELLAPAGSLEKAKIAFMYGADAVYAGTAKLSLRSRAELNDDSLEETMKYAHSIGKKVYVALNIYASDLDYEEIENQINILKKVKADAIIASDPGVILKIKEYEIPTCIYFLLECLLCFESVLVFSNVY